MRVLVLGAGMQGSATTKDFAGSSHVQEVLVADFDLEKARKLADSIPSRKVRAEQVDATTHSDLVRLMSAGFDVVACLLPARLNVAVARAAIDVGVNMVDVSYPGEMIKLNNAAKDAGVAVIPGCGLDPGIDLVLYGYGCSKLDRVLEIHSYCGGLPQRQYATGPLQYKVSWTLEGVLASYARKARILKGGRVVEVEDIMEEYVKTVDFPEPVGEAECFLNGDAVEYVDSLGLKEVREMTRWTVRWPGHCELWKKLIQMRMLSDEPLEITEGVKLSPREFMAKHLAPQLQYSEGEGDLVIMRVEFVGERQGKSTRIVYDMIDLYDPQTKMTAMSRTTGYTCSVVCQMIGRGQITEKGVLAPEKHIPPEPFFEELAKRDIRIIETVTTSETVTR